MHRKFLSNLGLLLLLNLLVKPFYILGIDAEVQNRVGQEEYGLYFALLNLSFVFNILIDLGINNFNNRNISRNEHLVSKHLPKLFSVKVLLSLLYAVFTLIVGFALGYGDDAFWMLGFLVLNQVLVSFILFMRSNLTALHLFSRDSLISVLDRSLLIVLCGVLLFTNVTGGIFHIGWFVYLQTAAYAITLIVALIIVLKRSGRLRWDFHFTFSLYIVRKSLPFALFILIVALYNRVDGIMLEKLLDDGTLQAGNYAQGFRFFEAAGMFAYLFSVLLLPIFSRMLKKGENVRQLLDVSARMLVGAGLFASVYFWFWSGDLLRWRYVTVSPDSELAFSLLMVGFTGLSMFYIYGTLLTAAAKLRVLNLISFCGLIINLLLNFYLIPKYGAYGAAFSTMATQVFAGVIQMLYTVRYFRYGVNVAMISQFTAFAVLFILTNWQLSLLDIPPYAAMGLSAIIGILLIFATFVIRPLQLLSISKFKE